MRTAILSLCALLSAPSCMAQGVDVDTTTFSYALARIGLNCSGADKYTPGKTSFSGQLSAEGRAGALAVQISAQERMDDQAATDAISDKYGRLRMLTSGEGVGDVPDELMPTPMPDDSGRMLYVLPADASGRYGIRSREQAVYKMLIGPLYCQDTDVLYSITLSYPFSSFSYNTAVAELNGYSCSVRIPPDKKELETLSGKTAKKEPDPKPAPKAPEPAAEPEPQVSASTAAAQAETGSKPAATTAKRHKRHGKGTHTGKRKP